MRLCVRGLSRLQLTECYKEVSCRYTLYDMWISKCVMWCSIFASVCRHRVGSVLPREQCMFVVYVCGGACSRMHIYYIVMFMVYVWGNVCSVCVWCKFVWLCVWCIYIYMWYKSVTMVRQLGHRIWGDVLFMARNAKNSFLCVESIL